MAQQKRVLIVEDDVMISEYMAMLCEDLGVEVVGKVGRADDALTTIRDSHPDVVLMDVRIPGDMDGVDVANSVYEEFDDIHFIFVTGSSEASTLSRLSPDLDCKILTKPVDPGDLNDALG